MVTGAAAVVASAGRVNMLGESQRPAERARHGTVFESSRPSLGRSTSYPVIDGTDHRGIQHYLLAQTEGTNIVRQLPAQRRPVIGAFLEGVASYQHAPHT